MSLRIKVVDIGDWDMDADTNKSVAHGLTLADVREVRALIRNDADTTYYPLLGNEPGVAGRVASINATNVNLSRVAGGAYDSTNFNATSYNRGFVKLWFKV